MFGQEDTSKVEWEVSSVGFSFFIFETPPYSTDEFLSFSKNQVLLDVEWADYKNANWSSLHRAKNGFVSFNPSASIERKFKHLILGFSPSLSYSNAQSTSVYSSEIDSAYLHIGFNRKFLLIGSFFKLTFQLHRWGFYSGVNANFGFSFNPKTIVYKSSWGLSQNKSYIETQAYSSSILFARIPIGVEFTFLKRIQVFMESDLTRFTLEKISEPKTHTTLLSRNVSALGIRYKFS